MLSHIFKPNTSYKQQKNLTKNHVAFSTCSQESNSNGDSGFDNQSKTLLHFRLVLLFCQQHKTAPTQVKKFFLYI